MEGLLMLLMIVVDSLAYTSVNWLLKGSALVAFLLKCALVLTFLKWFKYVLVQKLSVQIISSWNSIFLRINQKWGASRSEFCWMCIMVSYGSNNFLFSLSVRAWSPMRPTRTAVSAAKPPNLAQHLQPSKLLIRTLISPISYPPI